MKLFFFWYNWFTQCFAISFSNEFHLQFSVFENCSSFFTFKCWTICLIYGLGLATICSRIRDFFLSKVSCSKEPTPLPEDVGQDVLIYRSRSPHRSSHGLRLPLSYMQKLDSVLLWPIFFSRQNCWKNTYFEMRSVCKLLARSVTVALKWRELAVVRASDNRCVQLILSLAVFFRRHWRLFFPRPTAGAGSLLAPTRPL